MDQNELRRAYDLVISVELGLEHVRAKTDPSSLAHPEINMVQTLVRELKRCIVDANGTRPVETRHEVRVAAFTRTPGARYPSDGPYSGQEFRDQHLIPAFGRALKEQVWLLIDLDGTGGYAASFLDEVFGGLAGRFGAGVVLAHLVVKCDDEPSLKGVIDEFIREAPPGTIVCRGDDRQYVLDELKKLRVKYELILDDADPESLQVTVLDPDIRQKIGESHPLRRWLGI